MFKLTSYLTLKLKPLHLIKYYRTFKASKFCIHKNLKYNSIIKNLFNEINEMVLIKL